VAWFDTAVALLTRDEFTLAGLAAAARRFRSASLQLLKRTRATSAAVGACVPRPDADDVAQAARVKAVRARSVPAGRRTAVARRPSQEQPNSRFSMVFMALGRTDDMCGSTRPLDATVIASMTEFANVFQSQETHEQTSRHDQTISGWRSPALAPWLRGTADRDLRDHLAASCTSW
jgi:hypothetical protein